ncbi:hypothetical protein FJY63_00850 [Candidatus Sumerlaeota bacterium]|nr:hypothetical protein [Candidatus Sumerlaeota bacterium]
MTLTISIIALITVAWLIGALLPDFGPEHIDREGQNTAERTWGGVFSHHDRSNDDA